MKNLLPLRQVVICRLPQTVINARAEPRRDRDSFVIVDADVLVIQ